MVYNSHLKVPRKVLENDELLKFLTQIDDGEVLVLPHPAPSASAARKIAKSKNFPSTRKCPRKNAFKNIANTNALTRFCEYGGAAAFSELSNSSFAPTVKRSDAIWRTEVYSEKPPTNPCR